MMKAIGAGNFVLQDLHCGMYLRCYAFHMPHYCSKENEARRFQDRSEAEAYALEKGIDDDFVAIPRNETLNFKHHA